MGFPEERFTEVNWPALLMSLGRHGDMLQHLRILHINNIFNLDATLLTCWIFARRLEVVYAEEVRTSWPYPLWQLQTQPILAAATQIVDRYNHNCRQPM